MQSSAAVFGGHKLNQGTQLRCLKPSSGVHQTVAVIARFCRESCQLQRLKLHHQIPIETACERWPLYCLPGKVFARLLQAIVRVAPPRAPTGTHMDTCACFCLLGFGFKTATEDRSAACRLLQRFTCGVSPDGRHDSNTEPRGDNISGVGSHLWLLHREGGTVSDAICMSRLTLQRAVCHIAKCMHKFCFVTNTVLPPVCLCKSPRPDCAMTIGAEVERQAHYHPNHL